MTVGELLFIFLPIMSFVLLVWSFDSSLGCQTKRARRLHRLSFLQLLIAPAVWIAWIEFGSRDLSNPVVQSFKHLEWFIPTVMASDFAIGMAFVWLSRPAWRPTTFVLAGSLLASFFLSVVGGIGMSGGSL